MDHEGRTENSELKSATLRTSVFFAVQRFLRARVYFNSNMASQAASRPGLLRDLGLSQAAAVVVGTIIGSGIFLVPAEMMQAVGSAKLVYLAWLVGGVLSFFGALTYAELGAMKPQAGRRVCVRSRRLWAVAGLSLCMDLVPDRETSFDCHGHDRLGSYPGNVFCFCFLFRSLP